MICLGELGGHLIKRLCQYTNFIIGPFLYSLGEIATADGLRCPHKGENRSGEDPS